MTILNNLCVKYRVSKLYAFGSVVKGNFTKDSDIDLIVKFERVPLENYADNYFAFKYSLEEMFRRKVDLLEEQAIKNPFFKKSVEKTKHLIYG